MVGGDATQPLAHELLGKAILEPTAMVPAPAHTSRLWAAAMNSTASLEAKPDLGPNSPSSLS